MSDQKFSAAGVLDTLKPFQRATVDEVADVFYGRESGKRYLVADETGLGKSIVAKGVVARAVEKLQDDPTVNRIDIVYICSNADIARQNLQRLNVVGKQVSLSTRLTLLAASTRQLSRPTPGVGKPVNLISLTPRTSFPEKGWRTGTANERALLYLILRDELGLYGARATAAYRILQGTVSSWQTFKQRVEQYESELRAQAERDGGPLLDPVIVKKFVELLRTDDDEHELSALDEFTQLLDDTQGKPSVPGGSKAAAQVVIRLRRLLARAGVEALEPDLVILDEFQRFTELLEEDSPVSELAREMFDYDAARVLLLSATPYKPYDIDDESSAPGTHRTQFMDTLEFLARGLSEQAGTERADGIAKLLNEYREAVTTDRDPSELRDRLRHELMGVMCRTERPASVTDSMVSERRQPAASVSADEVRQYLGLVKLAELIDARLPMDLWKSVPEFVHFMDAYQLGHLTAASLDDPEVRAAVQALDRLDPVVVDRYEELARRNPRLDSLMADTTNRGWQQLLWVPPTVPYLKPAGPYADPELASMTKKLVFSAWSATPTAVASLLSHDASRRIARADRVKAKRVTASRENVSQRLQFRRSGQDLAAMAAFMLFFPLPGLADETDPLRLASATGRPYDPEYAEVRFAGELSVRLPKETTESGASDVASLLWQWPLMISDPQLDKALAGEVAGLTPADAIAARFDDASTGHGDPAETISALDEYVNEAVAVHRKRINPQLDVIPRGLTRATVRLALHSPANCAWRALGRLDGDTSQVTLGGRWRAAAVLASGLRTLFNRWESSLILDDLYGEDLPYWQRVLNYCADGNLQAVLDEYLFHLESVEGESAHTDESLIRFAQRAAEALKLNPAIYKAKDPLGEGNDIDFRSRFALRYGDTKNDESSVRATDVRTAFNSPFWPFVIVSTSVGQEGIDFHPWCHNIVHWNIPSSPVDFEQRDGRVNRYRGHAVRRNIAAAHSPEMLATGNPWKTAYDIAAKDAPHSEIPGLAPEWVYPGPHKVLRDVMPYQLSVDEARIERAKRRVAYYRLAFGQARQEDLVSVVTAAGVSAEDAERWRVDLRPEHAVVSVALNVS